MALYKINQKLIIGEKYRKLEARVKVALFEVCLSSPIRQSEFFIISGDKIKAINQLIEEGFLVKNGDILEVSNDFSLMFNRQNTYKYVKKSREKNKVQIISSPKKGKIECPYNEIIELYHEVLPQMPRVLTIDKARQRLIKSRWDGILMILRNKQSAFIEKRKIENPNYVPQDITIEKEREAIIKWFRSFFESIKDQPFVMGTTENSRKAFNINQIMREDIFTKICEKAYKDK